MKPAEEYLIKHMTPLIQRTELSMVSIDEMKEEPEWLAVIEAIKQAQHDAVKEAIDFGINIEAGLIEIDYKKYENKYNQFLNIER